MIWSYIREYFCAKRKQKSWLYSTISSLPCHSLPSIQDSTTMYACAFLWLKTRHSTSWFRLLHQQHHAPASWYSCSFITLRLTRWYPMYYFNDVLTTFLGLECFSSVAVYAGSESSWIFVTKLNEGLRFGMIRGWVINDRIFIFEWTIPFDPEVLGKLGHVCLIKVIL